MSARSPVRWRGWPSSRPARCPWTGDDGGSDDLAPALGPAGTLEALRADAEAVDPEVRRTAPALGQAVDGRVRFASGTTEGCEGGSFDGATAGYLVRGRLDAAPEVSDPDAVTRLSTTLAELGWDVSEPNTSTPDRTVVGGRRDGVELSVTVSDDIEAILLGATGPCRPVDDDSRDDAIGLLSREVLPRR